MPKQNYKIYKKTTVLGNGTAAALPAVAGSEIRLFYTDGYQEQIILLPGTYLAFKGLESIDMDDVDYSNMSIAEYDRNEGFFLK